MEVFMKDFIEKRAEEFVSNAKRGKEREKKDPFYHKTALSFFKALLVYALSEETDKLRSEREIDVYDYDNNRIKNDTIKVEGLCSEYLSDVIIGLLQEQRVKTKYTIRDTNLSHLDLRLTEFLHRNPKSKIKELISVFQITPAETAKFLVNNMLEDFIDFCNDTLESMDKNSPNTSDALSYYLDGAFENHEEKTTVIKLFTKHHCPQCDVYWETETTNIPEGMIYDVKCPRCGMSIKKRNFTTESVEKEVPVLIKQQFCVVYRGIDGNVETVICDDLSEAIANQYSFLCEMSYKVVKNNIDPEDVRIVEKELAIFGRCMAENDKGDAYILSMPPKTR